MFCPNCGTAANDTDRCCRNCGTVLTQDSYQQPQSYQQSYDSYQQPYQTYQNRPAHYSNGGLIAWSIITLLLCTIPGIVALVNACGINSCATVQDQQKKISATKTWCIVGTILGILSVIVAAVGASG